MVSSSRPEKKEEGRSKKRKEEERREKEKKQIIPQKNPNSKVNDQLCVVHICEFQKGPI